MEWEGRCALRDALVKMLFILLVDVLNKKL